MMCSERECQKRYCNGRSLIRYIGNNASVDNSQTKYYPARANLSSRSSGSTLLGENIPPPGGSAQDSGKKPQWGCVQAVLYELRMKCGG